MFKRESAVTKSAAPPGGAPVGYDPVMEIVERPTETLLTLTPLAAAKVKELMAEEPDADLSLIHI